jgi:hypothetical protein
MDELELDLEGSEDINKTELRIKNLSSKVRDTAAERDAAKADADRLKAEAESAAKERDFFKGFSAISEKYPGASEFQDQILEKVNAGYSQEDAAVSVLNANGKLQQQAPAQDVRPISSAGGGSAATVLPDAGSKAVSEMTQAERREALLDPDRQAELESILRGR